MLPAMSLSDTDNSGAPATRAPLQVWMHRHGWAVFLLVGLVAFVRTVVFANSQYGYADPVGFALGALGLALSGWFYVRRHRP